MGLQKPTRQDRGLDKFVQHKMNVNPDISTTLEGGGMPGGEGSVANKREITKARRKQNRVRQGLAT